jgi:hypothetical protein
MPRFEIRRVFEFIPGNVNGVPEAVPSDLCDAEGRQIHPLAWWPVQPFVIESSEESAALRWADKAWLREEQAVCLDDRIKPARFVELQSRIRPGSSDGRNTSVVGFWAVRQDDGTWHSAS